jgi:hypothetical protein
MKQRTFLLRYLLKDQTNVVRHVTIEGKFAIGTQGDTPRPSQVRGQGDVPQLRLALGHRASARGLERRGAALCDLARVLAAASGVSYVDFAHASGWSRPALCASLLRYYVRVLGTPIVA